LLYDEYSEYDPSTCSFVKENFPELYEKHFAKKNDDFLKAKKERHIANNHEEIVQVISK